MSLKEYIKSLSHKVLVEELKAKVKEERRLLNEVIELLHEVYLRKIYLETYSSLEEFCVQELGYSRGSAYRRVESMMLIHSLSEEDRKEIKSKIEDGTISLTNLTTVQTFFKNEAKDHHKFYTNQEASKILQLVENKSKLETQRELAKISPSSVPKQVEKVRYLSENELELILLTNQDFLEMAKKLKNLKSHINPNMSAVELFKTLMAQEIKRIEPKAPKEICSPASKKETESISNEKLKIQMGIPRSRYIPVSVKHKVWKRDNGECSHINKETGEVCQSKHLLQYDHIHEFSKWGLSNDPKNIRLLCAAHNRHRNIMKTT